MESVMDFYELTMAYTDLKNNKHNEKTVFDVFFRKNLENGGYNLACGLDDIIDFIKNFKFDEERLAYLRSLKVFDEEFLEYLRNFKFTGDLYAVPDGTLVYPHEPCITVVANTIEAQIIETDILNSFNHGSLIATKTRRIVEAAEGKDVVEFGARRAQGKHAAYKGAKYAYIAGAAGTSCLEAGFQYGVPQKGTMAHSHIQKYKNEYEAFLAYAKVFPNSSVFLVDTINTLESGVPNAIRVAKEFLEPNGFRLKGIRLDSGDLSYLSKEARIMLDEAGMQDCIIMASNSLDEHIIKSLLNEGAKLDAFGVGENLITSKNCPVFSGVYKLAAVEVNKVLESKIKVSDNVGKITNPGYKKLYRFIDKQTKKALADVIALAGETFGDTYKIIDPERPWKTRILENYETLELQKQIFKNGELIYEIPSLEESRIYVSEQMALLTEEQKRLINPDEYQVELSEGLLKLKSDLLHEASLIKKTDKSRKLV